MGSNVSTLAELTRIRARGQKPDGCVVVGDFAARGWAERNGFFFVDPRDIGDDTLAFNGLFVLMRGGKFDAELVQRLALQARMVTLYDTRTGYSEFIVTEAA